MVSLLFLVPPDVPFHVNIVLGVFEFATYSAFPFHVLCVIFCDSLFFADVMSGDAYVCHFIRMRVFVLKEEV